MTIDFRVAIDWQDNGHVNWSQDATSESDPLNTITSAEVGSWTVTNGSVTSDVTDYGLDFANPTSPPTEMFIAKNGSGMGEVSVSASTTYSFVVWSRKNNVADNAKNVRIEVHETGLGVVQASYGADYAQFDAGIYVRGSITFTTSANTDAVYFRTISSDAGWTGTYVITGLMVVAGSTVPSTFNDGAIKVLTHRTVEARWNIGYKTSIVNGSVANENRLECSLYNLDDYITEAKYSDVHRVYIEGSDDGGSNWTRLYTGWTRTWFPRFTETTNVKNTTHMKFTGVSSRYYLDGINARLAVQESEQHTTIVSNILAVAELPDGSSISTDSTNVPGAVSTVNYAGDGWDEGVDLLRALADTLGGFGFFGYFNRNDELAGFEIADIKNTAASSDFSIGNWFFVDSADYRYADPWYNMVEMKVSPRKLSATSTVRLWELPSNYDIPADDTVTILARYNDEDKPYQISARNVSVASSTFSSGSPTVTIDAKSNSCYINIDNTGGSATTLTAMRLEGQKIKTWDSYFEQQVFNADISVNGNNTKQLHYNITQLVSFATDIIQDWLYVFGEKTHRLWSIVVPGGRQVDSSLLDYGVCSIAIVVYPNASVKHWVIGEEWTWKNQGEYYKKLYLERLYDSSYTPGKP